MASFDRAYEQLVQQVQAGAIKPSRQRGTETRSIAGATIRVPIGTWRDGPDGGIVVDAFPALRCKRISTVMVFRELAWFLRGSTSAAELAAAGCHIWDDDAARAGERGLKLPAGELGPIYGYQWRNRPSGDQIARAFDLLVTEPYGRRNLVVSWNEDDVPAMVLPPCHYSFQFVCSPLRDGDTVTGIEVNCVVNMRSTDVGLGLPFNVVSYAMLTVLACAHARRAAGVGYVPGEVVVHMADCHLYTDHLGPLTAAINAAVRDNRTAPACSAHLPRGLTADEFATLPDAELKQLVRISSDMPPRIALLLHT